MIPPTFRRGSDRHRRGPPYRRVDPCPVLEDDGLGTSSGPERLVRQPLARHRVVVVDELGFAGRAANEREATAPYGAEKGLCDADRAGGGHRGVGGVAPGAEDLRRGLRGVRGPCRGREGPGGVGAVHGETFYMSRTPRSLYARQ